MSNSYDINYDAMTYRQYLQTEHWFDLQKRIINQRNNRCELCGRSEDELAEDGDYLNVHHVNMSYRRGHEVDSDLKVLCGSCHEKMHSQNNAVFPSGKYQFTVDEVSTRPTSKGVLAIVVSLVIPIDHKMFRVCEWFTQSSTFKFEPFFNSLGYRCPKSCAISDFQKTVGCSGKAYFIIQQKENKDYNNVKQWFCKDKLLDLPSTNLYEVSLDNFNIHE